MTSHRTNPASRAGHSVIRVPRAVAYMQGYDSAEASLGDADLRVYLAMVDLADNSTGLLHAGTSRVAHRAGVNVRSARRTIASGVLIDLGLISDVEDGAVHVRAPGDLTEGGYLSVPRAALWASPDAALEMPTNAVQALLLLVANSDWGSDRSTCLRCDRYIETMAAATCSVDRLKRGLGYLEALPWVRVERRGYASNVQRDSAPRRLASVRTLDWAALPAYQPRAVEPAEQPLKAPVRAVEAHPAPITTLTAAVPAQRRTAVAATSVHASTAGQLADTLMADAGSLSNVDLAAGFAAEASTEPRPRVVAALRALLDAGWSQDSILQHVRVQGVKTGAAARKPVGWLFRTALPQLGASVDVIPTLSVQDMHPTAKTLVGALLREEQQVVGRWSDEEPPF